MHINSLSLSFAFFLEIPPFLNSIKQSLEGKDFEHLLFSYHGVPERHIKKSDITKSHCKIDLKSRSLIVCNRRTRIFDKRNHA